MNALSLWIEIPVALLLVLASLFTLCGAIGLLRMKDFFQRMHPPALASTIGAWCVALASILYFSGLKSEPVMHAWLIPILLSITVPVTTLLLARTGLFRKRQSSLASPADRQPALLAQGLQAGAIRRWLTPDDLPRGRRLRLGHRQPALDRSNAHRPGSPAPGTRPAKRQRGLPRPPLPIPEISRLQSRLLDRRALRRRSGRQPRPSSRYPQTTGPRPDAATGRLLRGCRHRPVAGSPAQRRR